MSAGLRLLVVYWSSPAFAGTSLLYAGNLFFDKLAQ